MTRRRALEWLGATALTSLGGACGRKAKETARFAVVGQALEDPALDAVRRGAEATARDLEKRTGCKIEVLLQAPLRPDPAEQARLLGRLAETALDGIAVRPIDPEALRPAIDQAVRRGIPVVCYDADVPGSRRSAFCSLDDREVGRELARQFIEACAGDTAGPVAVLSGRKTADHLQNRVKGIELQIKERASDAVLLPTLYCDDDPGRAAQQLQRTIRTQKKLRGLLMVGGWALDTDGALAGIKDHPQAIVVAVGAMPRHRAYLQRGEVSCLIAPRYFRLGDESIRALEMIRTDTKTEFGILLNTGYDLLFKEPSPAQRQQARSEVRIFSVEEYDLQWEEWKEKGSDK